MSHSPTMADVQPPPLRSLDDFILGSARFAVPDIRNFERLNNRIINNLLYYQSNYFLSVIIFLAVVGYVQPMQLFLGATVVTLAFLGFVWAAENQASVRRFRRTHPSLSLTAILGASYLFLTVLGGVAVFLFGIAFPILRKHSLHRHTLFFSSPSPIRPHRIGFMINLMGFNQSLHLIT
uniref:PRA1 family protein n=1 Tax=Scleropages formosus TaxID=113540 RepID=A0A8C9RN50_SCLFO